MSCENCSCECAPIAHMLDLICFTLEDLGADPCVKDYTDLELLEVVESKLRALYSLAVNSGVPEEEVRNVLGGNN
jgi:hypothetical protein